MKPTRSPVPARMTVSTVMAGLCAVLLCTALGAQTVTYEAQSEGPLIGLPHGLSTAPGTDSPLGLVDESLLQVRGEGFSTAAPSELPMPAGMAPDYRASAILQGVLPRPDIDAFSTGLDWVLTNGDGVALIPPGSWNALSFSVTPSTTGISGTALRDEFVRPDGAAGDVFAFVLPGSALPPPLVGIPLRSQDSAEVAIGSPSAPRPDIDAHDIYVDLVWGRNPQFVGFLPAIQQTPRAMFSVSSATIGFVPSAWWGGSTPSGATVFCTEWDGMSWSEPRPIVTYDELGLTVAEEVDAVAVDFLRNELLFSTKTPGVAPVRWARGFAKTADGIGSVIVRNYRLMNGTKLPAGLDPLTVDDVDAVCSLDPGSDTLLQQLIGTPEFGILPIPNTELSVSVFRSLEPTSGQEFLRTHAAGWPAPGRAPGLIAGFLAPGVPTGFLDLPPAFPNPNRNPSSVFGGDPHNIELQLPPSASGIGLPVWFWWAAADQGVNQLAFSWPVRILL